MMSISASFLSLILTVEQISKERVELYKASIASFLLGLTVVMTFVPGNIEMYDHEIWGYPTLGMKGYLQITVIFITILLCYQLSSWLFKTWKKAPDELKKRAFWLLSSSILFYISILILFLLGIWLLVPIIYLFTTLSVLIAAIFIIKEPKLLHILSFGGQHLTIINNSTGEPIFELSWVSKDDQPLSEGSKYIEWAIIIEQLRKKIKLSGQVREIELVDSFLFIKRTKYITGVLQSQKKSPILKKALLNCIVMFEYRYKKILRTGLIKSKYFQDAMDIINQYFPLGTISTVRTTNMLKNHIESILKEKTYELELLKEKYEKSEKLKTLFLASVNHELREPLNSILGFLELILEDPEGDINTETRDFLETAYNSSKYLHNLINMILDISKIEAGKLDLSFENISLNEIIFDVIDTLSFQSSKKNIEISKNFNKNITLKSDKNRLKQILFNLLGNAIKFTPENGKIVIKTYFKNKNKVKVHIIDNGIGIAKTDFNKLFVPFQQIDRHNNQEEKGSGLGLFLVKKLITLLGGEIFVESEKGKGSDFNFEIPTDCRVKNNLLFIPK
ncbi:MAG: sensor histidine kinase [Promethearchaeota archaeon]